MSKFEKKGNKRNLTKIQLYPYLFCKENAKKNKYTKKQNKLIIYRILRNIYGMNFKNRKQDDFCSLFQCEKYVIDQ